MTKYRAEPWLGAGRGSDVRGPYVVMSEYGRVMMDGLTEKDAERAADIFAARDSLGRVLDAIAASSAPRPKGRPYPREYAWGPGKFLRVAECGGTQVYDSTEKGIVPAWNRAHAGCARDPQIRKMAAGLLRGLRARRFAS
jgi:hypothetical protein